MKGRGMLIRAGLTILALAVWGMVTQYISALYTNERAQSVVGQLSNDPETNAQSRWMAGNDLTTWISLVGLAFALLAIWWTPISRWWQNRGNNHGDITKRLGLFIMFLFGGMFLLSGCGEPAYLPTKVITIQPNESAFVIPYVGDTTKQGQFQSEQFLKDNQVATKQIQIPTQAHQTGGWFIFNSYEIIDAATVITVNRAPVSREWTKSVDTDSVPQNQAFGVESQESIDFEVGGTVAAEVHEEDAAKFLYHYPSQRNLADIMDQQVHQYMGALLFTQFKSRTLAQDQLDAPTIFTSVCKDTIARFAQDGITITSCGGAEGFTYHDKTIQDAINANFVSQQQKIQAQASLDATQIQNQQKIAAAQGDAQAAVEKAKGDAQSLDIVGQELDKYPSLIQWTMAQKYNGSVPGVVVGGNGTFPFTFTMPLTSTTGTK